MTRQRSPIAATLLTTALLGLGALPALADPTYPTYPTIDHGLTNFESDITGGNTFTLTVMPYASGELDSHGDYVGLTTGYLNDTTTMTSSDPFQMFCNDFSHGIGVPTSYAINIESLVGPLQPDPNPPGLGLSLSALQHQALLGANFGTMPTPGNPVQVQIDLDAQHDIWNYTGGGFTPPTTGMTALQTAADLAYAGGADYSGAFLFDIIDGDGQAFMPVDTTPLTHVTSSTPEPATLAMLGLGLIGLGSLKLRRRQR